MARLDPVLTLTVLATIAGLGLFVVYPLARVLIESVFRAGAIDLAGYQRYFTRADYRTVVLNTVILGATVAGGSTVFGLLYAYTLNRATPPFRRAFHLVALLPLISPPFLIAMSSIVLFGRRGLITHDLLGLDVNIYGFWGLAGVQTLTFFPVTYLLFDSMLANLAPELEQAALNLGASRLRVFSTVTLPLLFPALASAFLLIFVETLADLANPLILGGDFNVLATQVYQTITGQFDLHVGSAIAAVLLLPSLALFVLQQRLLAGRSYITVTGKPAGGDRIEAGGAARRGLQGLTVLLFGLIVLLYASVLFGSFTRLWGIDNSFTLNNFRYVLVDAGSRALRDTIFLSLVATPIAALAGLIIAVLVVRSPLPGRGWLDFTAMLGAAVPGTVIGIGFVAAFNGPPFFLTGTAAILIIVFAVRSMPTALRAGVAGLQQIDGSIEEAAINLGDNTAGVFRRVTLPLLRPALLTGMIYSFTRHVTSLSAIIFLTSASWRMVTAQILAEVDVGRLGNAAAYCVILMIIVIAAIGLLYLAFARWGARPPIVSRGAAG